MSAAVTEKEHRTHRFGRLRHALDCDSAEAPPRPPSPPAGVRASTGSRHVLLMYMSRTVGVAELRQNLSRYLERVAKGERLLVTDRNRPVAELGPRRAPARLSID